MTAKLKTDKSKDKKPRLETEKAIAFAYFVNDKWQGWYADSFGSIRDTPKIYRNSDSQIETITKNFNRKLERINETTFDEAKENTSNIFAAFDLFIFDGEGTLRGNDVELRIVEIPFFDGKDDYYGWISLNQTEIQNWAKKKPNKFLRTIKEKKPKKK